MTCFYILYSLSVTGKYVFFGSVYLGSQNKVISKYLYHWFGFTNIFGQEFYICVQRVELTFIFYPCCLCLLSISRLCCFHKIGSPPWGNNSCICFIGCLVKFTDKSHGHFLYGKACTYGSQSNLVIFIYCILCLYYYIHLEICLYSPLQVLCNVCRTSRDTPFVS